jgi:cholesterol transport system auxiliary component
MNKETFAFNVPASSQTSGMANNRVLAIKSLQVASPFNGRSLVYRTGEFSYQRDPYAEFLDVPGMELFAPVSALLQGNLDCSAVVKPGGAVKPDLFVEILVTQLYGDIQKSSSPSAVLAIQVTFLDAMNGLPGKIILQQNYSREIPIKSTAPAALMEGWNQALGEIFQQMAADLHSKTQAN